MKNIGLVSDLHLEGSGMDSLFNPDWDYLVIAGDLSANYNAMENFFAYKIPTHIPVIYVLGNHEYEGKRIDTVIPKIREIIKPYENVILLDNESVIIDGIKFIGSTLWTNFELYGNEIEKIKENMHWANYNISDFSWMFKKNDKEKYELYKPEDMRKESLKAIEFLKKELMDDSFEGNKVVISHFAPCNQSINKDFSDKEKFNSSYWVNSLEELMGYSKYWLHGHTHDNYNYNINGTEVICNPRGFSKMFNIASNFSFDRNLALPIQEKLVNKMKFK